MATRYHDSELQNKKMHEKISHGVAMIVREKICWKGEGVVPETDLACSSEFLFNFGCLFSAFIWGNILQTNILVYFGENWQDKGMFLPK